jgi:flagellar biosynthesis anti-sigma factor FlgM
MSKIDSTNVRTPFFPGQTNSPSRIRARNNASRKAEIDESSKGHASVSINQKIKDFSIIKKAVDMAEDFDNSEKISRLKHLIKSGSYKVNDDLVAERILETEY